MKYLLPCSCGQTTPIEISQAGETITCQCGAELTIPALREIRKLKPAQDTAPPRRAPAANWTLAQRLMFAIGLAIAAFGLARAAYFQFGRSTLDTREVADWDTHLDTDREMLENMNLEQAWESWLVIRGTNIGRFTPPQHIQARMVSDFLKGVVVVSAAIAVFGMGLMGLAVVLPKFTGGAAARRRGPPPRGD